MINGVKVSTAGLKRIAKERLFSEQRGLCHYCGELMILRVDPPPAQSEPRLCTLEHLYPRGHPMRGNVRPGWVAACHECNNKRGSQMGWTTPKAGRSGDGKGERE